MNTKLVVTLLTVIIICVDGKRSLSGRGGSSSARGTSRRTNYNPHPAPTSLSYPQPAAPKPSLSGWQEKPKQTKPQNTQTGSHSYPSSQTGLSGNSHAKPTSNQESVQRSSASQNLNGQAGTGQSGHSYPASNGLSGSPGSGYPQQSGGGISQGSGYPQQTGGGTHQGSSYPQQGSGLSGSGAPSNPGYKPADSRPPPYNGATHQTNNYGNNYQHPQQPPPYSNYGGHPSYHPSNGQMPGYGSQSPGYFGNYANNGNRGMSRSGSALTGVGIAGAGVGTLLTGLALWNLARSTGNRHHTVVYDNRGQPVAVAPDTNEPEANSMLADLVNCTLTISNDEKTEVLAIPCAIATSFSPDADVKTTDNSNATDNTKCTVTVVNKSGKEFMTTISCAILLNSAAENNVTEPPISMDNVNGTMIDPTETPILVPIQPALSLTSSELDQYNTTMNV
ncbi:Uncharacterized protein OBRU01_22477 [Operophtera brumata]|uniref:Uncharacterized protein n=1 Tax=Operophtera brumata TaxID=104452 RepID=A0A0L7KSJ7_OPEBR|nr:Uncharacterized protein OBRU01_22477 [Operophtera brumata]